MNNSKIEIYHFKCLINMCMNLSMAAQLLYNDKRHFNSPLRKGNWRQDEELTNI